MKYLLLAFIICTLSSCFKKQPPDEILACTDSCFIISGRLTDGLNPLPGVALKLTYEEVRAPFGSKRVDIATVKTNDDGLFHINFSGKKYYNSDGWYCISGRKDGHFSHPSYGGDTMLMEFARLEAKHIDQPQIYDLYLFKSAKLRFRLKDSAGKNVYVNYTIGNESYSGPTLRSEATSNTFTAAAGLPTIIEWRTYGPKGGIDSMGADTVTLTDGEEKLYEVR